MLDNLALQTSDLRFGHGKKIIGNALSFKVLPGQLIALVGPNGAGKTTLLQTISGFLAPISGNLEVFGQNPNHIHSEIRAGAIGYLPQDEEMLFPYTVAEVVSLGLQHRNLPKSVEDQEVVTALLSVEAGELATRSVLELSGGERQRVRLARAFAQNPKILLLDEPNVHLDPAWQMKLGQWILSKQKTGMTIIAALHDLRFAGSLSPHFLVLPTDGGTAIEGDINEIIAQRGFERCFQIQPIRTEFGLEFRPSP